MSEQLTPITPVSPDEYFGHFLHEAGSTTPEKISEVVIKEINPMDSASVESFLEGFSHHLLDNADIEARIAAEKTFQHSRYWPIQWASILMQSQVLKMHADPATSHYIYGGLGTNLHRWEDAGKAIIAREEKARKEAEDKNNQALV
jgi:hypothetical protein